MACTLVGYGDVQVSAKARSLKELSFENVERMLMLTIQNRGTLWQVTELCNACDSLTYTCKVVRACI